MQARVKGNDTGGKDKVIMCGVPIRGSTLGSKRAGE